MILSLAVYTGTAIMMAWLGWHVNHREARLMAQGGAELPFASWEILMAIIIYVAVSSVRWLTSWDYNMYYSYYVSMQSVGEFSRENFEPGFSLVTNLMAKSGLHFAFFFGFWAALQIVLLYYALRHRKFLLPWIGLCVMLGPYYIQWMNSIRQTVVECLLVVMVELMIRRKFWIYLLLVLLATTLHKMSLLLIPIYFVPMIPGRAIKRWMVFTMFALCVVIGQFPQWIQWIFANIGSLADYFGYGHYYRLFAGKNAIYLFSAWNGPARVFPFITCLFIVWYYPAIKKRFGDEAFLSAIYRLSLIHIAYLNIFANTTLYLRRPGDLFRATFLVMVCYTLHYLWRERKWLPFAAMAVLNFYFVFYDMIKAELYPACVNFSEIYRTFLF